jgi:predicted phage terminase large subunit-like protein
MTLETSQHKSYTQSQAAVEIIQRLEAKKSLIKFTEYTYDLYEPAQHHYLIADKLQRVANGEIKRLMIFMPPRHGKSELASRRFPAWYLGNNPSKQIIAASYTSDLATDFGREVRNIVKSHDYSNVFNLSLSQDSAAANRWHTEQGGIYVAAGVGTAVTGRGADILLIDDPVKDREEAESELTREKTWNWYTSTAYTRLMPNGAVIVIQTRWHEDDLSGRLLEEQEKGGDQWEILNLAAIGEDGQALWPEWYDTEALNKIKGVIGERDWNSLYQQNPTPDEGSYFKREWIRWYDHKATPKHLRVYGASDYAVTDDGGDYTVHSVFGVDPDDDIYLLDVWRGQTNSEEWVNEFVRLVLKWEPSQWAEENGQILKSVGPFLQKAIRDNQAYCYRKQYASAADKAVRAQAIRGRVSQGKVYFPNNQMGNDFVTEMTKFPAGKHDDQVDTLSLLGRMLNELVAADKPKKKEAMRYSPTFNELLDASIQRQRMGN